LKLLLDTHVFLWAVSGSASLSRGARDTIVAAEAVYVSAASIWEIAIKARLGKIEGDCQELLGAIDASGFVELAVTGRHAAALATLALHHTDPFDRLLVAQALTEPLQLLTADRGLAAYGSCVEVI
jgi:PIN domain nuclease of toxin-antitoxin system